MSIFGSKSFLGIFLSLFYLLNSNAQQLPTGSWRIHLPFSNTRICAAGKDFIYGASQRGFFKVHIGNSELTRLSAMDGFHNSEITTLNFYKDKNFLLIGYADGFIDLLKNDKEIISISGFKNKSLQGDKSILNTCFYQNYALVSTHFGILVLDLTKYEIKESYFAIGQGALPQEVLSTAISGDSIFAGIPTGIISAQFSESVNLNDYNNWKKVYTGKPVSDLTAFADTLYFYSDSLAYNYKNGITKPFYIKGYQSIVGIEKTDEPAIIYYRQGAITKMDVSGKYSIAGMNIISSGTYDKNGDYWFTTGIGGGLIKKRSTGELGIEPNGPANLSVFAMSQGGDNMFCTAGGVTNTFGNAFNPAGFYIYHDFGWENNPTSVFNQNLYDFTYVYYNPVTKKTYVGSHTNGMLEFKDNIATNKFDDKNSPLFRDAGLGFIRVSGIASDADGNTWVACYGSPTPLNVMSKTGTWTTVKLLSTGQNQIKKLIIDQNGYKWMILQSGGIGVFDDNKTPGNSSDDNYIVLNTSQGLITNDVTSLAIDKTGYVWVGTSQGLNVFTNTSEIFTKPKADRFIIDQNGTVGYLLGEETINDICVDGGNRKWIATNNGVFLVEADGQKVDVHYSEENSPLLSNKVTCIGQQATNGEVFFGTENGIISYRSDASEADEHFKDIKIYPNPVKPGYSGKVTIEGLARDAEIRITDAAGMLVYQTKANGGTAIWPCTRLDGSKPNSGVLYVFGINTDGKETAMGKFIYIK